MDAIVLNVLLAVGTSLIASALFWWVLFKLLVPHVRFSTSISKFQVEPSDADKTRYGYRVKFENAGRRGIIDLQLRARVRIRGLWRDRPRNLTITDLAVMIDGSSTNNIARLRPVRNRPHTRRFLNIFVNSVPEFADRPLFPDSIRNKARDKRLMLEDLLSSGTHAELWVEAFGYDEFSGTRTLFLSKTYTVADIRERPFRRHSLEIDERSSNQQPSENEDSDTEG